MAGQEGGTGGQNMMAILEGGAKGFALFCPHLPFDPPFVLPFFPPSFAFSLNEIAYLTLSSKL